MEGNFDGVWRESPWFLTTPPEPRGDAPARARVSRLIDAAVAEAPLVLVLAPPGYGKTGALAAWALTRPEATAWLTLTRGQVSPRGLVGGILSALTHGDRGAIAAHERAAVSALLGRDADPLGAANLLLTVIAERTRGGAPGTAPAQASGPILVIDDAHLITDPASVEILEHLARHGAEVGLTLVLVGHGGLERVLSRTRAYGRSRTLGADDLAMRAGEIARGAEHAGIRITDDEAARIQARTQGWPIAVHLELIGRQSTGEGPGLGEAEPVLTDLVTGLILGSLRAELTEFILRVTTCDRVSVSLAEALSGRSDSAALLAECERSGLFLTRFVDGENSVYRWHDVFARHCRIALRRDHPALAISIDSLAARALAAGYPIEASGHALRAGQPETAVEILRGSWLRLVLESGAEALRERCVTLPDVWPDVPEILLMRACALDALGDPPGAASLAARARSRWEAGAVEGEETRILSSLILTDERGELAAAADRMRELIESGTRLHTPYAYVLFILGLAETRLRRNPAETMRLLRAAAGEARASGFAELTRWALINLRFACVYGGRFRAADEIAAEIEADAREQEQPGHPHVDGGIDRFATGFTHFWRGDREETLRAFEAVIARDTSATSFAGVARVLLAVLAAETADPAAWTRARRTLTAVAPRESYGVPWPLYRDLGEAVLAFATGDRDGALARLATLDGRADVPMCQALAAEVYRRAGDPDRALGALALIGPGNRVSYLRVSALVTSALILADRGEHGDAHDRLERALDAAVTQDIRRPFAAEDPELAGLLEAHSRWGSAHEGFLASLDTHPRGTTAPGATLSTREREILGYLRTTLTAEEIARELHVSVNTVRTHQRAIYRKLGVTTRREAVRLRGLTGSDFTGSGLTNRG
ncbi:LuxR C-terminal-related transcriptional regulator [Mycetocola sp. JXN-3]|uniref:LuxR C-terminal-related transcriptional regulator n=1 Tax=Mycetocola sp. JXN-3 TaxID=2116510 RepID=UPI00165D01D6|nr:LuxR C-terminal-related transcriptional regulator [Mycetocola sp. JXN-3]